MKKVTIVALVALCALGLVSAVGAQSIPQLNEISRNDPSGDDHEFVEICADPNTDMSAFWVIEIEGDSNASSTPGVIKTAVNLTGLVGASGLYTLAEPAITCADQALPDSPDFENGGTNFLLVRDFSGSVGMDIDLNDDCIEDGPFPGMIVDGVGMGRPSQGDCFTYYGIPGLGPDTGSEGTADFDPAGVARCEDCTGGWGMICLAGAEGDPVCFDSNPDGLYNVAAASPCSGNLCAPISVEDKSWGVIKGQYK